MMPIWLCALLGAAAFAAGIVGGMRIRSQRILDAVMEQELAPGALPPSIAAHLAARRRTADATTHRRTAGGTA